ncbi:MAG: periplasmic nitrate reductase, NapE protein [Xanthomonadales bacterium]|nr:periplasmic nitrate reductase, NapE protein [Xanthomonadales bacterium]
MVCLPQYGEVARVEDTAAERRRELRAFLFLTVFLAPILAVGLVASWGFVVWIFQMFAGPPGPQ